MSCTSLLEKTERWRKPASWKSPPYCFLVSIRVNFHELIDTHSSSVERGRLNARQGTSIAVVEVCVCVCVLMQGPELESVDRTLVRNLDAKKKK